MIGFALLIIGLFGISGVHCQDRTYVDDLGVTHTTSKKNPKIVTWAHRAVTLRYFGLDDTQLLGTYGEWGNSGSDFNVTDPEASSFPLDPGLEDVQLLQSAVNLSPGCGNEFCVEFDIEKFKQLNPDEFIIHGYRGSAWAISSIISNITEAWGKKPIFVELSMDKADKCQDDGYKTCAGRSMIEVIDDHFKLAEYLDLSVPESMKDDRRKLCKAASTFQDQMKVAHDKGLRVFPAYLGTGTSYYANVKHDMVLRMFEELGMPILHNGACTNATVCSQNYFWEYVPRTEYFQNCSPDNITESCNNDPLYPVDVWLYDHRTTFTIQNDDFALAFPDKAIIKKQYAFWPIGGRITTPHHAAKILEIVGSAVSSFERLHPPTNCTDNVDVSSTEHKINGIGPNNYACYDTKFHEKKYFEGDHCLAPATSPPTSSPTSATPAASPTSATPPTSPTTTSSTSGSIINVLLPSLIVSFLSTSLFL